MPWAKVKFPSDRNLAGMSDTNHNINLAASVKVSGDPSLKNVGLLGDGGKVSKGMARLDEKEAQRMAIASARDGQKIQIEAAKQAAKIQIQAAKDLAKEMKKALSAQDKAYLQATVDGVKQQLQRQISAIQSRTRENIAGLVSGGRYVDQARKDELIETREMEQERKRSEAEKAKAERSAATETLRKEQQEAKAEKEKAQSIANAGRESVKAEKDRIQGRLGKAQASAAIGGSIGQAARFFQELPGRESGNEAGVAATQRRLLNEAQRGDLRGIMELQQNGAAIKSEFGSTTLGNSALAAQGLGGAAQIAFGLSAGPMGVGHVVSGAASLAGAIGSAFVGDTTAEANARFEKEIMHRRLKDPMTQAALDQMQSEAGMRVHGGYRLGGKTRVQQAISEAWDLAPGEAVSAAGGVRGSMTEAEAFGARGAGIDNDPDVQRYLRQKNEAEREASRIRAAGGYGSESTALGHEESAARATELLKEAQGKAQRALGNSTGIFGFSQEMGRRGMDASGVAGILGGLSGRGSGALEGRGSAAMEALGQSIGMAASRGMKDARLLQDIAGTVSEAVVKAGGIATPDAMAAMTSWFTSGMGANTSRADVSARSEGIGALGAQGQSAFGQQYLAAGANKIGQQMGWNADEMNTFIKMPLEEVMAGKSSAGLMHLVHGDVSKIPLLQRTHMESLKKTLGSDFDQLNEDKQFARLRSAPGFQNASPAAIDSALRGLRGGLMQPGSAGSGSPVDMNSILPQSAGEPDKGAEGVLKTVYETRQELIKQEITVIEGLTKAQNALATVLASISQQNSKTTMEKSGMYIVSVINEYKEKPDGAGKTSGTASGG